MVNSTSSLILDNWNIISGLLHLVIGYKNVSIISSYEEGKQLFWLQII